jgi:hypothetical protein
MISLVSQRLGLNVGREGLVAPAPVADYGLFELELFSQASVLIVLAELIDADGQAMGDVGAAD